MSRQIIVGISGASGAPYAVRLVELLAQNDVLVHLVVSRHGRRLLSDELGIKKLDPDQLTGGRVDRLIIHNENDVGATIASGSLMHDGMIVVPCSGNTLAKIACGITDNLLQRAATVTLKERRTLVLAHRESPLSLIELENMKRVTESGGTIVPLSPGFYLLPQKIEELIDFMVAKLLDLVGVDHDLDMRWDANRIEA